MNFLVIELFLFPNYFEKKNYTAIQTINFRILIYFLLYSNKTATTIN